MFEILTVCTGNICRSPLAEQLLRARLADLDPVVASAGTRGLPAAEMTPEAAHIAHALGVPAADTAAHRSRFLTEQHLIQPDLILAMTRTHRRTIAELAPTRLRSTFTIREFARLAMAAPAEELRAATASAPSPSGKVRAAASVLASYRGLVPPPDDPADDDVIDPYRQPWETYLLSAQQLEPAATAVAATVRAALS
ncbi:low molecular weight phosphatase family protein [Microbacterium cremeum]|uniref:arsenate reductase/protein-tyrosine-phosphatase family protein n=1 Tax=Microbacterium cremeum TaxID=2782169 RepID=UPI00188966CD|nr:low molecular weight phosphatase family protein [Microbacterium cremeum]